MIRMTTPEQDYGLPYTNFVQYGREWADNGVRAVQVVGWNIGGQDADDPSQDTDPGLGTWQQWHDAIAQVQGMGVKVILFAKLNWADLTTSWYSNELYKYQCTDPDGRRYEQGGYAYVTPTQLAGIGLHRRAVMDFQDPESWPWVPQAGCGMKSAIILMRFIVGRRIMVTPRQDTSMEAICPYLSNCGRLRTN
jgi:hypothetical protein